MGTDAPLPIEPRIHVVRGQKVMLGPDLAAIFDVPAFRLNEAVKRNADRFPDDFVFQLVREELVALTSQSAMSKPMGRGGRRTLPYAFTEHGALMLASVLNSPRAVEMSIYVVRAFVRLRQAIAGHREIAAKLDEIEHRLAEHDDTLSLLVEAVRQLMQPPPAPDDRPRIGFTAAT